MQNIYPKTILKKKTLHGSILNESRGWISNGFYEMMEEFKRLVKLDWKSLNDEQIEEMIVRTCFVPMRGNGISYELKMQKQSAFVKITPHIRRKTCQSLYRNHNIIHLLCDTLLKVKQSFFLFFVFFNFFCFVFDVSCVFVYLYVCM